MPDLIIDGIAVSVPDGTSVIEAAESVGIVIPRLCWHKALGPAGACRLCAVMFTDGPVKGLRMSCMTQAADGMVVDTGHPKAVAFRRQVLEWLMANHPHDCPVCDEGGGCLLQDMTIAAGHSLRRFPGHKRTYPDQDLGPFIQHEMNRCIHCYRCARFYQEYAGYRDFGPMQNANRVYFGRFRDGPLDSPFAGNLADICPTGTLTDKTARYKARRWETERVAAICPHCALGCHTVIASRNREIVRIESREHPEGNGFFLCDRGRFSHGFEAADTRPRHALVGGKPVHLAAGLDAAIASFKAVIDRHGPQAVACLGGVRSTLETQATLAALARNAGWREPAFFTTATTGRALRAALAATTFEQARPLTRLEHSDAVVCLGVSPLADAPMLALALRQAWRHDAPIVIVDPRPLDDLPLTATHLPVAPHLVPTVWAVLTAAPDQAASLVRVQLPQAPELWEPLIAANASLAKAEKPALVFDPALAPELAFDPRFGLCPLPHGANAFGAVLAGSDGAPGVADICRDIQSGGIKALLVVETDPWPAFPALAEQADALGACLVLDHLPTETVRAASIVLPTATLFESGGTLCDHLGRPYRTEPAHAVGEPVSREGGGDHPPRDYARPLAGTDPRPAARLLEALGSGLGHTLSVSLPPLDRSEIRAMAAVAVPERAPSSDSPKGLTRVWTDTLFGTEELGRYAPLVRRLMPPAAVTLHPADAANAGLADGDTAEIVSDGRFVPVAVHCSQAMARGVIVVPRLPELAALAPILDPHSLRRRQSA